MCTEVLARPNKTPLSTLTPSSTPLTSAFPIFLSTPPSLPLHSPALRARRTRHLCARRHAAGAFAHGKIDASYVDEEIAVSAYPLSAAYCIARITNAFENKWGIV